MTNDRRTLKQKEQHVQRLRGRGILVASNLQIQGLTWGKEVCRGAVEVGEGSRMEAEIHH